MCLNAEPVKSGLYIGHAIADASTYAEIRKNPLAA
jgi:hypothetical protein